MFSGPINHSHVKYINIKGKIAAILVVPCCTGEMIQIYKKEKAVLTVHIDLLCLFK